MPCYLKKSMIVAPARSYMTPPTKMQCSVKKKVEVFKRIIVMYFSNIHFSD